ncbi:MAG TPA: divalent-cation tolerance protein CutA [Syntrophorhabdales bacterium]|nr:divalent-cation tolerance protein CutA [Syntrophorhabdales bacterium]
MEPIITITTTADDREALEKIGRHLLNRRLIACIQIVGPIKSIYWWKNKMEETSEWLGIMKSKESLYAQVEAEIGLLHPYEVPQIVASEVCHVLPSYGQWVLTETGGCSEGVQNDRGA